MNEDSRELEPVSEERAYSDWLKIVASAPELPFRQAFSAVGPYRIVRELGRGGMGVVYEAVHAQIGQRVAIKVLQVGHMPSDQALERLIHEARAASTAEDASVVQVFDVARLADGTPYILMEFVRGEPLRDAMQRHVLPLADTLRIIGQVARTLSVLHERGVVHRDLKPENVMLCYDEDAPAGTRVKLVDFGVSALAASVPSSEYVAGTPAYMAPELCVRGARVDAAADAYALGVLLFEMLTGVPPFAGDKDEILHKHQTLAPPLAMLPMHVPHAVSELVAALLEKQPRSRPRADEAARVVRSATAALAHAATLPRAVSEAAPTPVRRRRALWWAVGLMPALGWLGARQLRGHDDPPVLSDMAWFAAGAFTMGRDAAQIEADCKRRGKACHRPWLDAEQPAQEVHLSAFALDRHEVTNREFTRMLNATPPSFVVREDSDFHVPRYVRRRADDRLLLDMWHASSGISFDGERFEPRAGAADLPVINVSWDGAQLFCRSRGKRLPTEAEWERAARGVTARSYAWGDEAPDCARVVFGRDAGEPCAGLPRAPAAVGSSAQDVSPEGVFDLAGNVMEWVDDAVTQPFHPRCGDCIDPRTRFHGVPEHDVRALRGGGWGSARFVHATARFRWPRDAIADDIGFRCAAGEQRGEGE